MQLGGYKKKCRFEFAIPPGVNDAEVLDVGLEFERTNAFGVAAILHKLRVA